MQLGRGDGHIELKARATLGGPKRQDSHHPIPGWGAAGRRRRGACCSGYNLEVHTREGPGRTVLVELDQHAADESIVNYDAAGLAAARVVRLYDSDGGADARLHSAPQYRTPRAAKRTAPPRSLAVAVSM